MSTLKDLTGMKFHNLTIIKRLPNTIDGSAMWECLCDCGNITAARGKNIRNGAVKSCGCLRKIPYNKTHGMSKSRLYKEWAGIKARCCYKSAKKEKSYGGRGISICEEWKNSFDSFKLWALKNGYNDSLTIERIDFNGDYCPDNCRWIPFSEQCNNKRSNIIITYNGKTQTLSQWCKELCLDYKLVNSRIKKLGWSFEKSISEPVKSKRSNKGGKLI